MSSDDGTTGGFHVMWTYKVNFELFFEHHLLGGGSKISIQPDAIDKAPTEASS